MRLWNPNQSPDNYGYVPSKINIFKTLDFLRHYSQIAVNGYASVFLPTSTSTFNGYYFVIKGGRTTLEQLEHPFIFVKLKS